MNPEPSPPQGIIAGRFTIKRKLGSGSLGTVFLAHDEHEGRAVALKLLRTERLSVHAVQRFQREFGTLAALQHPRIAAAYDFGYTGAGNLPFYTREYIEGAPLPAGPPGPLDAPGFLQPILDLLQALEYLHRHGILHLDVHPGNLIVASDAARGSVLIDFGLFQSGIPLDVALPTQVLPPLPPEVLRRDRVSPATDVFLAGRLLLHRLSGEASSEARLPREIPGWGTRLTLELERIAAKALEADPSRRFPSAAEFHAALARALGHVGAFPRAETPAISFIGREAELGRIETALQAAAAGKGAVLCLKGQAGLGKTRLLRQARVRAQLLGLEAVEARFYPDSGPGSTLAGALGAGSAGTERRRPWMEALDAAHGATPEERARRAALAYFEEEGKPTAFLLDDLDQAERSSRILAGALIEEAVSRRAEGSGGRGICILCSTSGDLPRGIRRRDVLRLKPLRLADARRLLEALAHPLVVPPEIAARGAARARGSPLRIRQVAQVLISEWGRAGAVPPGAELPDVPVDPIGAGLAALSGVQETSRAILQALAVLAQPASCAGIAFVLNLEAAQIQSQLKSLERAELVASVGRGSLRLYQIGRAETQRQLCAEVPGEAARRFHRRMARFLESHPRPSLRDAERLARHLLLSGSKAAGLRQASRAALRLRRSGHHERAVALLEEALAHEGAVRRRFALLEELSSILEEIGDHGRGVSLLDPFSREALAVLPEADAIRLRRRLGVHLHRSGRVDEAVRIFEEAERSADPRRDTEELIFIDSELAELHTLRGQLDRAEDVCRRGLARLESLRSSRMFRARMEVVLRASRGHLELRRFRLEEARAEFRSALRLAGRFRMPATRAVILNNLGIAENQLNDIGSARRAFREAERLFLSAGEKRSVLLIACNLAVIAAKLGRREESRLEVERVERMLRRSPGSRLEFYAGYTRGIAASLLGDMEHAIEWLTAALPLGRKLGDVHHVRFGEITLHEAQMACGRYIEAWKGLRPLSREAKKDGPPILVRMVHSRLLLLSVLLGHRHGAEEARLVLERAPRTGLHLLEAWNDLFVGLSCILSGEPSRNTLEKALKTFQRFRVHAGERSAAIALLLEAMTRGDEGEVERELGRLEQADSDSHRFLAVARPLVLAEALAFLGNLAEAREKLSDASGAIIGSPFLELDWRIEHLRARLSLKEGDTREGRAHLHRAIHARDLLGRLLPARARKPFLAQSRFRGLEALRERLDRSPRLFHSSPRPGDESFEGMLGRSPGMRRVFQAVDRLRDQELPVLITGESGTGKELVARALHRTSIRSGGPFFVLHAGSLPIELFESELLGHEKGAFTGAEEMRPGLLESLAGGTVLIDGVSELAPAMQAKLLRILDSGRARRLGADEERPIDVRFLSSDAADLRLLVETGVFRADLLYRLSSVEIQLPPLRERSEDIPLLARHFLELHARRLDQPVPRLEPGAIELLAGSNWPGNVRQLETVLLRVMITLTPPASLGARELEPVLEPMPGESPEAEGRFLQGLLDRGSSLESMKRELERFYLVRMFRKHQGDQRKMMEDLGWKQSYFYARLKELGIDVRRLREDLPRD